MAEAIFLNEKGNEIAMSVRALEGEVVVDCRGPSSHTEHRWTTMDRDRTDGERPRQMPPELRLH
jgi:hypothetical protein